ncbi:IclR family transcriptional regulator [Oscillatoria laete-virens NRMC-F 0139]|nr:IclR family transcriptional regulator [Oscillatoria laete-virens]MDL5055027.1 IclR family transcriptional regulator [Oscillatoria laete-virens NRMC-F 0139]
MNSSKVNRKNTSRVIALDRGLEILEAMTDSPLKVWPLKELSSLMGMDQSSVYRTIQTLIHRGLVRPSGEGMGYILGFQAYRMAHALTRQSRLTDIVSPFLKQITGDSRETSHLAVRLHDKAVIIDSVPALEKISISHEIGFSVDIHVSAIGKCFLFDESPIELARFAKFKKTSPRHRSSPQKRNTLIDEIEESRHEGFALDCGEHSPDVWCAAAPIRDFRGKICASIGVSGPANRMKPRLKTLGELVKKTSKQIDAIFGHSPSIP